MNLKFVYRGGKIEADDFRTECWVEVTRLQKPVHIDELVGCLTEHDADIRCFEESSEFHPGRCSCKKLKEKIENRLI